MEAGIPAGIWEQALAAQSELQEQPACDAPEEVFSLVEEREAARARRDWATSDELRDRIADLGWQIRDTAAGPQVLPL
jgi:cysteinyl-tRNA synthetase